MALEKLEAYRIICDVCGGIACDEEDRQVVALSVEDAHAQATGIKWRLDEDECAMCACCQPDGVPLGYNDIQRPETD